jgi:DNA-directed RNA polymerase specialized sigma24 family protein
MGSPDDNDPQPPAPFPHTQWSLVEQACHRSDADTSAAALSALLQRYLPALRAHLIQNRHVAPDHADDLLQGFVADKIIEQRMLDHAREHRGKLRTFLLATLNNYVVSHHRHDHALKRLPVGGVGGITELDDIDATAAGGDPAWAFNVAWARQLLGEALDRMRAECDSSGRADLWAIFEGRVVLPAFEGAEPIS